MATECVRLARGRRIRLTRENECGAVVEGPNSTLTTDAIVTGTITPNYADPTEISILNGNGDECISDRSRPALRWLDINLNVCVWDPWFINLVTGDPVVVDDATPTPNTVGWSIDTDLTGSANFGMEIWSNITGQACDPGGNPKYQYWLFPWVKDAQWGEWVPYQNDGITATFTARAVAGGAWGVGPYDDVLRSAVTPATLTPLLTPIGATQPMRTITTSAPLPAVACGATVLPVP
ncbi:hypothetical protein ABZ621_36530 [Streptomyces sp. NPDC007863]|uniref:hypothetical protein n=1 Tax=Streptomyces sp. NPDC007863 TaxID=3154894 RepID=UPI0033EAACA8